MHRHTSELLNKIAAQQHGLVHSRQAALADVSAAALYRAVESGHWRRASPTVVMSAAAPVTVNSRVQLGLLDAGLDATLSHSTAASVWDVPGFELEPVHVLLPRFDKPRRNHVAIVHRTRALHADDVTERDGWPITTPTRTLFDLASCVHPLRLERVLDAMWARRLVDYESLHCAFERLRSRGRKGIVIMRELIEARKDGYRAPESQLERRFESLLINAGLPAPERQLEIYDADGFVARVDYGYRAAWLLLFVDGDAFHTAKLDQERDAEQTRRLERLGYRVLRFSESDVRFEGFRIVDVVRRHLFRSELGSVFVRKP